MPGLLTHFQHYNNYLLPVLLWLPMELAAPVEVFAWFWTEAFCWLSLDWPVWVEFAFGAFWFGCCCAFDITFSYEVVEPCRNPLQTNIH